MTAEHTVFQHIRATPFQAAGAGSSNSSGELRDAGASTHKSNVGCRAFSGRGCRGTRTTRLTPSSLAAARNWDVQPISGRIDR